MAVSDAVEERRIFMLKRSKKINIKYMVMAAFLTALSIVLTRFLSVIVPIAGLPTVRVGFGRAPIVMSGLLFGPLLGGLTGAAADLIGVLINPMGTYHPGFTISAVLDGVIPGILAILFRKRLVNGNFITLGRVFIVELILTILNSIILNTLWLTQLLGKGYMILLPARVINAVVNLPIQTIIIYTIMKYIRKMVDD
jgi:ECF transporter S component (folate family)